MQGSTLQQSEKQVSPAVVGSAADVVFTVVVSSVVVPSADVTTLLVVTFTLLGTVCGWSLAGPRVDTSTIHTQQMHKKYTVSVNMPA